MIADTTFLIDILTDEPSAVAKANELEVGGIAVSVGAPTVFELYVGASRSRRSVEEKAKITSIVASLPQLPLDYESAKAAGEIYAGKVRAGSTIDTEDAMLAGISRVHREPILTRNVKHFSNIEGVSAETY